MAAASTFNPRESTRPASRFDALREELIKAQRTSQAPPNTQSREPHTTPALWIGSARIQEQAIPSTSKAPRAMTASGKQTWALRIYRLWLLRFTEKKN
ncbi:hypothetical protein ASPSYDRAFT_52288 [Aspergillus sydowii CBS 593.65]|uniref:Uncharacterized protein n=1 Tax=Aspergillus sydowii CBS 593.65 TaxID=1036612 RepID=A0A1L9SYS3_9EURO|nr:uncharacterized protein ASPSYDRAFT_52288 [Aspergillus sydowii CBS 593.65]OJJ52325.1 hypothetical protein ASPSYDRAFT_52288 [Aspergillus sydowii CBS 593.65]